MSEDGYAASDTVRTGADGGLRPREADSFVVAVRTALTPVLICDAQGPDQPIVFANDAFCRMTGYAREEVLDRNCRFLKGPQTDPAASARMGEAIASGKPIGLDIRNYRKNGTSFWNRIAITPVHDAAGTLAYFVASQSDVTLEVERIPDLEANNDALLNDLAQRVAALEESEARFRHMADNSPVVVWTADASGACTWLSRLWGVLTGQRDEDGLGSGWLDAVHPDDQAMVDQTFMAASDARAPARVEYRLRRADGSYAWVIDAAAPRISEDGALIGYVGSVLDITDRRHAEERLELSEESLRLATEAAGIGTWDIDLVGGSLTVSERMRQMFGLPAGTKLSRADYQAAIYPSDRAMRLAPFAEMIDPAMRSTYDVEYRVVSPTDGAIRWLSVKGKGLFAPDGRCLRAIGTAMDITARKAAQARETVLLTLADRLRSLSGAAAIAAATREVLDRHFGTVHVGFAAVQVEDVPAFEGTDDGAAEPAQLLAALSPAQLAGLASGKTMLWGDASEPCDPCDAVGVRALLIVPLLRDGALAALCYVGLLQPRPWLDAEQSLIEHIAARAWDAMERSRAEAALRELNATLESRVDERTAELQRAEEALRQSQKMEAVGQLTGGIAHDFNNLLTGIVGALDLLQRRLEAGRTDGLQRYADIAITAAQRAGALTQRLLAFARRQPLDPRPTDATRLISDMADLLGRTLGPSIKLQMELNPVLWPTMCDANQLESAILNLAINARDAMPQGGHLTIKTANAALDEMAGQAHDGELRPGQYTLISVTDSGTGMTRDTLARAFEPFFTTKPIGQGTGLGLSMLYGFAKQSNGHVRIESELGRGTAVFLYLPQLAETLSRPERPATAPAPARSGVCGTVLVVDDEVAVRALVLETLGELGYTTLEAADGATALRILQSAAAVEALVTDVGLPGLNGRQLANAARALRPDLPVLFITGYVHNAAIGDGVLEPGMEMITKPFAMAALATKIQAMMLGQPAAGPVLPAGSTA